ncbi:MAG TPA: DUF1294 domain-containing protein [Herpetosiphonaceae bacterium]|nr:DUF1294 domain-containing protein [Herpetosiphonaceae bacterium]
MARRQSRAWMGRSLPLAALVFGLAFGAANLSAGGGRLAGVWLTAISILAFVMFMFDKESAKRGARRTPEDTLLLLVALGGALGAGLAMLLFRHKTSKRPFIGRFWLLLALQVAGVILIVWLGR